MGEAKAKKGESKVVTLVHFKDSERLAILMAFLATEAKDRHERQQRNRACEALDLDGYIVEREKDDAGRPTGREFIKLREDDKDETDLYELTGEIVDYVLEKLNGPTSHARYKTVMAVEDRLLAVKDKRYELPEEFRDDDAEEAAAPVNGSSEKPAEHGASATVPPSA